MNLSLNKFPFKTKVSSKNENTFCGSTRKGTKYNDGRTTGLTGVRNALAKGSFKTFTHKGINGRLRTNRVDLTPQLRYKYNLYVISCKQEVAFQCFHLRPLERIG